MIVIPESVLFRGSFVGLYDLYVKLNVVNLAKERPKTWTIYMETIICVKCSDHLTRWKNNCIPSSDHWVQRRNSAATSTTLFTSNFVHNNFYFSLTLCLCMLYTSHTIPYSVPRHSTTNSAQLQLLQTLATHLHVVPRHEVTWIAWSDFERLGCRICSEEQMFHNFEEYRNKLFNSKTCGNVLCFVSKSRAPMSCCCKKQSAVQWNIMKCYYFLWH